VLDPSARALLACELRARDYVKTASLGPDDALDFERPFPVRISMPYLCRGLDPD
jgi:hypothetical protein